MNTRYVCPAVFGLSGLASWLLARLPWMHATVNDDKAGDSVEVLSGAAWATELQIASFALIAFLLVALVTKSAGRRVTGVLAALAGAVLAYSPIMLLTAGADSDRVWNILATGAVSAKATDPVRISQWAEITGVDVSAIGPGCTVVAAAAAIAAGVILAMRPGKDTKKADMLEATGTRRQQLESDIEAAPDSERVMWDALDEGIDLTGRDEDRG
ncbi:MULTISPECIES: TIGR02234 family membrane protein [Corynebacterium]|uniref:TIGR02234 family membrane protein n=2 Tax=Corynebacterium glucuronolyticum TaxID=39791 RepID=A0AAX1L5W4_9CORY|nr:MULTISPECIES: TIGR02234 family membrane protein [Corynebacterium]MCT1441180.1 TIGR02234 family membrane protein [Corynebacterium glucuronolyticum]MCT1562226.1 TIGR02234 family membrane protein [Corynebacterium glucuronolyticum]QQU89312.1 TIGR02234 family membrane protein [Corynebacterium glucuronolyticum]QRO82967.1 TIGR02234 family membrane protein [Corynebacterium glucuronolyticum]QRP69786.1 TIGR02234 family membrane protein [Corynebacterium glucuronolyticum]